MPDEIREYLIKPLSPVHIGSGDTLAPEDYLPFGETLVRFNSHAVVRAFAGQMRARYEKLLDDGQLGEALNLLRSAVETTLHNGRRSPFELYRSRLGESARREVAQGVLNPARTGHIHALQRNPYTGDVVLPGSSFKGAIRTAVVSAILQTAPHEMPALQSRIREAGRNTRAVASSLETTILGRMETDPLRLLEVADASWPGSDTRIDKAFLGKLGRPDETTQGMGIYLERLPSQADNAPPPECRLRVQWNSAVLNIKRGANLIRRPLSFDYIEQSCSWFYQGRFNAEWNKFQQLFGHSCPWRPPLVNGAFPPGSVLIRVGRHCHFDSLSIDGLRQGWNAHKRDWIHGIGATRTLCSLEGGKRAPFGWVLLQRVA
jgi:CRISPR-associated protein Csm5